MGKFLSHGILPHDTFSLYSDPNHNLSSTSTEILTPYYNPIYVVAVKRFELKGREVKRLDVKSLIPSSVAFNTFESGIVQY